MISPKALVDYFYLDFGSSLRQANYLYADTRIPWVSLYDHLVLTAAFATVMVRELSLRGMKSNNICGLDLADDEVLALARLCGLMHDLGKARIGETEYRFHVQRGVEYAQEWLDAKGMKPDHPLYSIIINSIARHHLRDQPQSVLEKVICLADSFASAGDRPELARASTASEFERLARRTMDLEQELFGQEAFLCLLMGDVDAIKAYVYDTK